MRVGDVMTKDLVTVGPDTPFKEVVEHLVRSEVSSVPVVDAQGRLVGLITEADLISKEAYGGGRRALGLLADVLSARDHHWVTKASGSRAANVMTTSVVVCRPDDDVRSVARRMLQRGVKRMPVVDGDTLVGIVSRRDILAMFDRPDEAIAADVGRLLEDGLNIPYDCHVGFAVADGVVTLTGDVRYGWDEPIIVTQVRDVPGVIDVISQLHHRKPNPRPSSQPPMFGVR
jgi:CBS domain-containing protein